MKKIGLLSDTHGNLPQQVFNIFSDVDLIIHAGDIGSQEILIDLQTLAPVHAVYGNMDGHPLNRRLHRVSFIAIENITICATHIVNNIKTFSYELFKMKKTPDVVVFGHTHRAEKTEFKNILYVNPGSTSFPRGGGKASLAVLKVEDTAVDVEFFKLNDQ